MSGNAQSKSKNPFAPLKEPVFRTIWSASVLANLGHLILGVGAAWDMTRLTTSTTYVALVQTSLMLPLMLASVPAGAVADMFDRRKVAMMGLGFSILSASTLTFLTVAGLQTPLILLLFCFLIGVGVAFYTPAWSASINDQVSTENLPTAIALGTISYNVARSFGPALGGVIVLAFGAQAAFGLNGILYIPLLLAFMFWRRDYKPPRLPNEGIGRAVISGTRYVFHSPILKRTFVRVFLFGLAGATATALSPLLAKERLGGDAATYGLLLGASGAGAVLGALCVSYFRARFGTETSTRFLVLAGGAALIVLGLSQNVLLSCLAMFMMGVANMLVIALYNVAVQLHTPRWVLARALSLFSSALTGGIAIGAWVWGEIASNWTVESATMASGVALGALSLVFVLFPIGEETRAHAETIEARPAPDAGLPITLRSGPVVIEIECRVAAHDAREFYHYALKLRPLRLRNGGYNWSISRDISDPTLWIERYSCPTWADYLRIRDRQTAADQEAQRCVDRFLIEGTSYVVRRRLDRPFGSVRWKDESPDPKNEDMGFPSP